MLAQLPPELICLVVSTLSKRDIKNLRLTCARFFYVFPLRIERVFLSANPVNIRVFRAIAQHEEFRHQVVEIIYDDARLLDKEQAEEDNWRLAELVDERKGVPKWYSTCYEEILSELRLSREFDIATPYITALRQRADAPLSKEASYRYFSELKRQEAETRAAGDDAKALAYGLERFPNLRRITLTPTAHGTLFEPLYETPAIRDFPSNFVYPISITWRCDPNRHEPWDDELNFRPRGFELVARVISQHYEKQDTPSALITEFVVEMNHIPSGIPAQLFQYDSQQYDELLSILQQPGFSRLDLAFRLDRDPEFGTMDMWDEPLLRDALAAAKDLQHISLAINSSPPWAEGDYVPLESIFPFEVWQNLSHFGLVRAPVQQDNLVDALAKLTPTLRSVELSYLYFVGDGTYRRLLEDMRAESKLGWMGLPERQRPRITIYLSPESSDEEEHMTYVDVSLSAEAFVYRVGVNPFTQLLARTSADPIHGIEKGTFYRNYDRPYAAQEVLQEMGITKTWTQAQMERDAEAQSERDLGEASRERNKSRTFPSPTQPEEGLIAYQRRRPIMKHNIIFKDHTGKPAMMSWRTRSYRPKLPPLVAAVFYMTSPEIKYDDFDGCRFKDNTSGPQGLWVADYGEIHTRYEFFFLPNATPEDCVAHYKGEMEARGTLESTIAKVDEAMEQRWENSLSGNEPEELVTKDTLREMYARPVCMDNFQANLPGLPWVDFRKTLWSKEGEKEGWILYKGFLFMYPSAKFEFNDEVEDDNPVARLVCWKPVPGSDIERRVNNTRNPSVWVQEDILLKHDGSQRRFLFDWVFDEDDVEHVEPKASIYQSSEIYDEARDELKWEVWGSAKPIGKSKDWLTSILN